MIFTIDPPRPTKDIDCVTEITSHEEFNQLEAFLMSKGFKHDVSGGPICRWLLDDVIVDVMPTDQKLLGFSNKWYTQGIENQKQIALSNKVTINIFTEAYFIASKFEAFLGRKENDYRYSHDIEDILTILNLNNEIVYKLTHVEPDLRAYLQKSFVDMKNSGSYEEIVLCHLGTDEIAQERAELVLTKIEKILNGDH